MQAVSKPGALPGSCVMPACGSATRRQYIDTGLQFEFYGAVYICDLCLGEMARLIGFLEPEYVQELKNKLEEAQNDNYLLTRQVDGLRMAVDGLSLARGTSGTDTVSAALLAASDDDAEPRGGQEGVDSGEVGPPEPLHDEGVAKLPDDASGNEFRLSI